MTKAESAPRLLSTAEQLALVQLVAERLAGAEDVAAVARAVASSLRQGLEVTGLMIGVLSDDGTAFVALHTAGLSSATETFLAAPTPLDRNRPARDVLERRQPVVWETLEDRDRQYPEFAAFPSSHRSWVNLPLIVHGVPIGMMTLGWQEQRRFSPADLALLGAIAHQCALAVDRARLDEARRAERETLELLSEGTRLMVSALEPERVLAGLIRLVVPGLAPWGAVYVPEGDHLVRVAIEIHGHPELAKELRGEPAVRLDSEAPIARAFRSGETRLGPVDRTALVDTARRPQLEEVLDPRAPWQVLAVPVRAGGDVIGVMSLVASGWAGRPPDPVLFAADGLAGRAGVALANARRFERERETAALLTEAVLPSDIPMLRGYDAAARYLPAGGRVAGDWFDVMALPSGGYLLGVGDAGGHGLAAAALMAQLRNAARGLAVTGKSAGAILHGLNLLSVADSADNFATALYGVLELERGALTWSSAGHLPPLVYRGGTGTWLESTGRPPLGWPSVEAPGEAELVLAPGESLVLVTDGVVERRAEHLGARLEQLAGLVGRHGQHSAGALSQRIVEEMCVDPEDDCCVVVLKRLA